MSLAGINCLPQRNTIMKKTFKVAVVGCGTICANHINALTRLDNVKIVALCDINTAKAEKVKAQYALDSVIYDSYEKMLESEALDAVHVATPHYLHAPMAISALSHDINVFLEKPICITTDEIEQLIDAEANSRGKVCVCFQNRFNPSVALARKLIDEDGGIKSAYGAVFWYRGEKYYTESGWRGTYATEGGGVMINQAIHTIDLLCQFLGKPKSVCATIANHHLKGIIEVEDSCEGIIGFENGKKANFYATTAFDGKDSTTLYLVTENKRTVMIQHSDVYVNGVKVDDPTLVTGYIGKECYGNGHTTLIANFYDALENGKAMPVTLESAQYALRILLAAYISKDTEIEI